MFDTETVKIISIIIICTVYDKYVFAYRDVPEVVPVRTAGTN